MVGAVLGDGTGVEIGVAVGAGVAASDVVAVGWAIAVGAGVAVGRDGTWVGPVVEVSVGGVAGVHSSAKAARTAISAIRNANFKCAA